ncbi:MAG: hypothetical protein QMD32_09135 [Smithellaceae bacterium]|nr:hypothetical protein [Smithellaceae bacterium]
MNCPKCEKTIPEESRYCLHCGVYLLGESAPNPSPDDADPDWDNRVLCSDGNCTGIIVDGKCTTCGIPG